MNKAVKITLALVLALGLSLPFAAPASAQAPSISLTKAADCTTTSEGSTITYTYKVDNTGDTPLYDVSLADDADAIALIGLSDEDADGIDDDLASGAEASGTLSYTVEFGTDKVTIDNTAIASGWYEDQPYTATATLSIPVERKLAITLTKTGPKEAGFESVEAKYVYEVENIGNCSLTVTLTDDQTTEISGPEGDDNGNSLLDPAEVWTYSTAYLIECTEDTQMEHVNVATAVGTDATGATVEATARWKVLIFQWQPRTIGYWGNWDNHWTDECMADLVSRVNEQSAYFEELTPEDVHDILLARDQKGKMSLAKATALLEKQLLAAWLNIKSYEAATDDAEDTCGALDAALNPEASVFVDGTELSVGELIQSIEDYLSAPEQDAKTLLMAKDILDDMNNAEDNGYMMFMP